MYLLNAHPFQHVQSKSDHRRVCLSLLPTVRALSIPSRLSSSTAHETVLIEFRALPHLEFLIRNTILLLPPTWRHTVVCGKSNYKALAASCETIPAEINLICLPYHNLTPPQYSRLLLTQSFWNLFTGEKLLIYQEDSILFRGDIEPFLPYDYVGAPWPHTPFGWDLKVGNGGFSLRSRSVMLACLQRTDLELAMVDTYIPEDVVYSYLIQKHQLGRIPSLAVAKRFSEERVPGQRPLGGHQYWLARRASPMEGATQS